MVENKLMVEDIISALTQRNKALKCEIDENSEQIKNVHQVVESIDSYFYQLPKFFELSENPTTWIHWNYDGNPFIVVGAHVRRTGMDIRSMLAAEDEMVKHVNHHAMVILDLTWEGVKHVRT